MTTDLAGTNDALTAGLADAATNLQATADSINANMNTMRTELDAKDAELVAADVAINLRIDNTDSNLQTEKDRNDVQDATLLTNAANIQTNTDNIATNAQAITDTNTKIDNLGDGLTDNIDDNNLLLTAAINALEE